MFHQVYIRSHYSQLFLRYPVLPAAQEPGEFVAVSAIATPKSLETQSDARHVIRNVLLAASDLEPVPRKLRVVFRYPDGKVGHRDVATHWLHSYPAKMFHRIPRQILSALDRRGDAVVLDPFCGSGTVLIEAALRGNDAIGIDINPLARLLTKVKSTRLPSRELRRLGDHLIAKACTYPESNKSDEFLDFWFKREAQIALFQLRRAIDDIQNPTYKNFFLITFSSIIRRCSLADPAIPPPVRLSQARIYKANGRYRRHLAFAQALTSQTVYDHFSTALSNNIRRIGQLDLCRDLGRVRVLESRSEAAATTLSTHSVDLILTSPPYCGAQKYARTVRLELYWLGYTKSEIATVDRKTLGTERIPRAKDIDQLLSGNTHQDALIRNVWDRNQVRATMLSAYFRYLKQFLRECRRVLRPTGDAFVTLGTSHIAGIRVDMADYFSCLAVDMGFTYVTTFIDSIPSRGLLTERHRSAGTIHDEQVVWLKA